MTQFSQIIVFDCQVAGISGDMTLGALLDLGADKNKVTAAIKTLENPEFGYKNVTVEIKQVMRREFRRHQSRRDRRRKNKKRRKTTNRDS